MNKREEQASAADGKYIPSPLHFLCLGLDPLQLRGCHLLIEQPILELLCNFPRTVHMHTRTRHTHLR